MTPVLSLVVCTRNRAERLRGCLAALAAIRSSHPWEAIVVDNGSIDATRRVVEEATARFPVALRLVSEPEPGVAGARNTGWRAAAGAIVAYTDDDCYPASDFVDLVLDRFDENPELGFLGGTVLLHDPDDAAVAVVRLRDPVDIPPRAFVTPGLLISANLAFRREVLEAIDGFDPAFGYAGGGFAGEDVDAAARASVVGWRGRYDPALVVHHHHGRRPGPDADAARRAYGIGSGAFFAKSALDRRLRRIYLAGWVRLTADRLRTRGDLRSIGWEVGGALRYLRVRWLGR